MCRYLGVARSHIYYRPTPHKPDVIAENAIIEEFKASRGVYGQIKIKKALEQRCAPIIVSPRKVGRIMKKYGLVSKYVMRRKKKRSNGNVGVDGNGGTLVVAANLVERNFVGQAPLQVVTSDLTYVKVAGSWHYVCLIVDLHGRKIVGSACGRKKDKELVKTAFYTVKADLRDMGIFHSDRGGEFKNKVVEDIIKAFGIKRSLSAKGCPGDNAVSESMYNILKTELVFGETFESLEDLDLKLFDFVNWYNNKRLHSSLNYMSPNDYVRRMGSGEKV